MNQLAVQLDGVTTDNDSYVSFTFEFQLFCFEVTLRVTAGQ